MYYNFSDRSSAQESNSHPAFKKKIATVHPQKKNPKFIEKFETDSSIIEIKDYEYINSIRIFNRLKKVNKVYYRDFFYDTKGVKEHGTLNKKGVHIGSWKFYDKQSNLIRTIDYDRGTWYLIKSRRQPYYNLQRQIKLRGDSIIQHHYGKAFFDKHVSWNIFYSRVRNADTYEHWETNELFRPTFFLLAYNVHFDQELTAYDAIRIVFDSKGRLVAKIRGFEPQLQGTPGTFLLTQKKAWEIAQQVGLKKGKTKAEVLFQLLGEQDKPQDLQYRLIIRQKIDSSANKNGYHTSYLEWVFNPWKAHFVAKNEIQTSVVY